MNKRNSGLKLLVLMMMMMALAGGGGVGCGGGGGRSTGGITPPVVVEPVYRIDDLSGQIDRSDNIRFSFEYSDGLTENQKLLFVLSQSEVPLTFTSFINAVADDSAGIPEFQPFKSYRAGVGRIITTIFDRGTLQGKSFELQAGGEQFNLHFQSDDLPAGALEGISQNSMIEEIEGIITTLTGLLGEPSDVDGSGRIDIFVFSDPELDYTYGFFNPDFTFTDNSLDDRDDGGDGDDGGRLLGDFIFLNAAGWESSPELFLGTFAHELQHLIYNNQRYISQGVDSKSAKAGLVYGRDLWFNEGMSMLAEYLAAEAGWLGGGVRYSRDPVELAGRFITNPEGGPLAEVGIGGIPLESYGGAFLFCLYLAHNYGETNVLTEIARRNDVLIERAIGDVTGKEFSVLLAEFGRALALYQYRPQSSLSSAAPFGEISADLEAELIRGVKVENFPLEKTIYPGTLVFIEVDGARSETLPAGEAVSAVESGFQSGFEIDLWGQFDSTELDVFLVE